jgi:hypothetical protein
VSVTWDEAVDVWIAANPGTNRRAQAVRWANLINNYMRMNYRDITAKQVADIPTTVWASHRNCGKRSIEWACQVLERSGLTFVDIRSGDTHVELDPTPVRLNMWKPIEPGIPVVAKDGSTHGYTTGKSHWCPVQGCYGHRISVRWAGGRTTYPCSNGITYVPRHWRLT